ncbi:MAG: T9SS type A sorting domain-containing protein [Bacteroidota bacterium]
MKKLLLGISFLVMACNIEAQLTTGSIASSNAPGGTTHFYQYKPPHYNNTDLFPLIISLHGVGQAGNNDGSEITNVTLDGLPLLLKGGTQLEFTFQGKTEGFIMLAPQANRGDVNSWPTYYVDEMIAYGIANLRVDPARVFLTGFSAGGGGVWKYVTSSATAAAKLAGIVPVASSSAGIGDFCYVGSQKVAVWTFHGGNDQSIPAHIDHANITAVNNCSPIIPAVDTIIDNESHGIYMSVAYDVTNKHHYPNVFQWMLKVNRNINPATDAQPVPIIAGGNTINLTTPVKVKDFPVLDGSGSTDDDIIMDYLWEQVGANNLLPNVVDGSRIWPTIKIAPSANMVGIDVGTYTFRLRVKDYLTSKPNHTQFATLTVNVQTPGGPGGHSAPATNAGSDHVLASAEQFWTNSGSYLFYNSAFKAFNWRIIKAPAGAPTSGPLVPAVNAFNGGPYGGNDNNVRFVNMETPGNYEFEFSVTNNFDEVGKDTVVITRLSSALPVTYAYFNGKNAGTSNVLNWATTVEVNSDRFDILRSADGVNFSKTGSVSSTGGAVQTEYSFEDKNAPLGKTYYRLSQVDKDGRAELSKTVLINNNRAGISIEKYPNPVHDNLMVSIQGNTNGSLQVAVADMQGKTIIQQQWQKDQSLLKKIINVASLQNGVYQMIITVGNEKQVSSFVKY